MFNSFNRLHAPAHTAPPNHARTMESLFDKVAIAELPDDYFDSNAADPVMYINDADLSAKFR